MTDLVECQDGLHNCFNTDQPCTCWCDECRDDTEPKCVTCNVNLIDGIGSDATGRCPDCRGGEMMTTIETVKETIGHCNFFMLGTYEARDLVQRQLDRAGIADWRVGYSHHVQAMPDGAVRVGQVKVRHGDPEFPIWVRSNPK